MNIELSNWAKVEFHPYRTMGVFPMIQVEYDSKDPEIVEFERKLYEAAGNPSRDNHVAFELTLRGTGEKMYIGFSDWKINIGVSTYSM